MITSAPWALAQETSSKTQEEFVFRKPERSDGYRVHSLIESCPPLDTNSSYCNFLQTTHFKDTCIVAELDEELAGFISAYRVPEKDQTLFIWQVAVSEIARGQGLAFKMIQQLLAREELSDIRNIETTITRLNKASWALFKKVDQANGNLGEVSLFLDEEKHFDGKHDSEYLYRIPLKQ
ncbi:diaminobutyrate acetyltransferase [Photobacterium sp. CCB-ST2H9]|uniref:diaminobutyrate acetyltransferase n=1 Tax=unclassified Photobacterium TaxID=2628852 RepID=UPI0020035AB7|nr:diaminobutyrate acetyltransferase [Photobacterium sp. CCB-ST2H9]UTM58428.1 diaminobutyrate acetyltransferase [Photobacterium sp. CCB-ST2H9]